MSGATSIQALTPHINERREEKQHAMVAAKATGDCIDVRGREAVCGAVGWQ
jgi:hypothetical protein